VYENCNPYVLYTSHLMFGRSTPRLPTDTTRWTLRDDKTDYPAESFEMVRDAACRNVMPVSSRTLVNSEREVAGKTSRRLTTSIAPTTISRRIFYRRSLSATGAPWVRAPQPPGRL
jgi:hypothetical protein